MELTPLMLCGVALLAGKCYSDAVIQQCPYGEKYVTQYSDVSITCGQCRDIIHWYVDDNSGEHRKYVGECRKTTCNVDNSAAFRLKANMRNILDFDSVLDIIRFTRNTTSFVCECYYYFFSPNPFRSGYYLESNDSCQLLLKVPPGNPQLQCPETVFEGSNVSCKCTSANKGSPPAKFVWDGDNTDTLFLQNVRRENNALKYTCRQTWGRNGLINRTTVYTLRVTENKELTSDNVKGRIVGGVFAAVVAIIATIVAVYTVKQRKGVFCKLKVDLRSWPCLSNFCRRKKPLPQSYAVINRSQTPVSRYTAPSGDLYTVANTTTSGDVNGEYVTVDEIIENTTFETDNDGNLQTNQDIPGKIETRKTVKPTIKSQPTTGGPGIFSDLSGTGYMNVTEVPTDSGLGVYHIVPWAITPTAAHPDIGDNHEAVLSEEEYNVLKFEEDRTGQEDQGATYHHLEHK